MGIVRHDYTLPYALETEDMDGYTCKFDWDNYHTHLKDHPVLEEDWFWPARVKETLKHPDLVIEAKGYKSRHIYWKQHGDGIFVGGKERGARTKVIVEIKSKLKRNKKNKVHIISAWHISNVGAIKELSYTECEVIYSNGRFCDKAQSRFK